MRVLLQSTVSDLKRGAGHVVHRIATAVKRERWDALVVLADDGLPPGSCESVSSHVIRVGCQEHACASYIDAVACLVADFRPDVVNCHMVDALAMPFIDARRDVAYKLVATFHGLDTAYMSRHLARQLNLRVEQLDAVVCVSRGLAHLLCSKVRLMDHPIVIHNGIAISEWPTLPDPENARIISIGALSHAKGHDVLLRAFHDVIETVDLATLVIVGDGPWHDRLVRQRQKLGLDASVTLTGFVSHSEVQRRLRDASVFAFPSRNEGFGLALLEAMAVGRAPVASAVGGIPELLGASGGLLVHPDDHASLGRCLIRLLTDRVLRMHMAAHAVERAKRFTYYRMTDGYIHLYRSLITRI